MTQIKSVVGISVLLLVGLTHAGWANAEQVPFEQIAQRCAPDIHPATLKALIHVESGFNPYAIGVVGGRLARQPRYLDEAVATAKNLEHLGYNFSLGAGQVNRYNLAKYGETYETIFEPCRNLKVSSVILKDCFIRARARFKEDQTALRAAFSCYYSGNFTTGFQQGYVGKVVASAGVDAKSIAVVPSIKSSPARVSAAPGEQARPLATAPGVAQSGQSAQWVIFTDSPQVQQADTARQAQDDNAPVQVKLARPAAQVQTKVKTSVSTEPTPIQSREASFVTVIH